MSDDPQWIDPITGERLMRGARSGPSVDPEPLADLLAAAATPARPGELAGEEAAVTAFRDARLVRTRRRRRRFVLRSVLVRASVVSAVAVVGGGGVALAASTGHLPGTMSPDGHATARTTAGATVGKPARSLASMHTSRPAATSPHGTRAAASHDAEPGGSPSPNLRGLCTAFRTQAGDPGTFLDKPAFKVLVKTAGGKHKVAAYCRTLLAKPAGRPSTRPGKPPQHPRWPPGHHVPVPSHRVPLPTHTPHIP